MANGKDPVIEQIAEFEDRLNVSKSRAQKTREARMKCELKTEQLKGNESELIKKIKSFGLDPENLKSFIIAKQKDLNAVLTKLEGVLPDENGKLPNNIFVKDLFDSVNSVEIPDVTVAIPNDVSFVKAEDEKEKLVDFDKAEDEEEVEAEKESISTEAQDIDDMPF